MDRAKTVVGWITKVSKPETALWTLTLGQYDKNACKQQEDADFELRAPGDLRRRPRKGRRRQS